MSLLSLNSTLASPLFAGQAYISVVVIIGVFSAGGVAVFRLCVSSFFHAVNPQCMRVLKKCIDYVCFGSFYCMFMYLCECFFYDKA